MCTHSIYELYLVNPKSFPDQRAHEMAAGADDLLEQARVVASLDEALAGCELILATSARPRGISLPGLIPVDAAALVCEQADDTEVAIVFGREHAGLTNEELLRCHYHIHIPSNPEYSSLNLSQAVQIVAYELRVAAISSHPGQHTQTERYATAKELQLFYDHFEKVLVETNFQDPDKPGRVMTRLKRLFNRSRPEAQEINILRGILTTIQKKYTA